MFCSSVWLRLQLQLSPSGRDFHVTLYDKTVLDACIMQVAYAHLIVQILHCKIYNLTAAVYFVLYMLKALLGVSIKSILSIHNALDAVEVCTRSCISSMCCPHKAFQPCPTFPTHSESKSLLPRRKCRASCQRSLFQPMTSQTFHKFL